MPWLHAILTPSDSKSLKTSTICSWQPDFWGLPQRVVQWRLWNRWKTRPSRKVFQKLSAGSSCYKETPESSRLHWHQRHDYGWKLLPIQYVNSVFLLMHHARVWTQTHNTTQALSHTLVHIYTCIHEDTHSQIACIFTHIHIDIYKHTFTHYIFIKNIIILLLEAKAYAVDLMHSKGIHLQSFTLLKWENSLI